MKKILLFAAGIIAAISMNAQECSKLFISEYVEGSAQNKALEIYNPTNQVVSLDGYKIQRYSNGSPVATHQISIELNEGDNVIQPYDAIVITNGQIEDDGFGTVDSTLYFDIADMNGPGIYEISPMFFNGDDCIVLLDNNNIILDFFGVAGQDPSPGEGDSNGWCDIDSLDYQSGPYFWLSWTSNHTMIRKPSVRQGDTNPNDPFNTGIEWDTLPQDTWTNLGIHDCDCNPNSISSVKKEANINLYPNPTQINGTFKVFADEIIKNVRVINMVGKVELTVANFENDGIVQVNTDDITAGIYLVEVTLNNNIRSVRRITIQ